MNKRLTQLLQTAAQTYRGGAAYLDCYNQALYTDIAPTITTRVYESNMYYLMEEIKDPIIITNPHGYYEGGEYPETSPTVRSSAFQANTAVAEPLPAAARPRAAGDWHTSQHRQTLELGDPAAANSVTSVAKDSMIVEPTIASMKSRDKDNPTGVRTANNGNFAQRLEPSADQSTSNTITSVAKDNLLAEPAIIEDFYPDRPARVYKEQVPTIRSDRTGLKVTEPAVEQVGQLYDKANNPQYGRIYNSDGVSPTLVSHGSTQGIDMPKVVEPAVLGWTRSGDSKGNPTYHPVNVANCVTAAKRDNTQNYVVEPQPIKSIPSIQSIIEQAKTAHPSRGIIIIKNTPCWVRRLTERELFRLMDVEENDIDTLLNAGISNTQLAKLAGNSIVTSCMYYIFHALFIETTPPPNTQTQLF